MMEWDLLEKTTFWVTDIDLEEADLGRIASVAANVLGLPSEDVMVVDVRPGTVTFDILRTSIQAESVIGKEREVLEAIAQIPGVKLGKDASIHSEGVLGLIALDPKDAPQLLERTESLARNIAKNVKERAIIFASGTEVIEGKIKDTNSPYLLETLNKAGYKANFGGILEDNVLAITNKILEAIDKGYGLIITTGGVGAEDKDCTVEAILKLDPTASTPWILKFKPDYKRHHKESVRIAVGNVGLSWIIALPGPHEEVEVGCERLLQGLEQGLNKVELAEYIADALRERWLSLKEKGGWNHGLSGNS
jgi:molybdenum cofactor synthesis domain-containing protein